MSTASVLTLPPTSANVLGLWLQKGLNSFRTTAASVPASAARPSSANRQEAEKLRTLARDMMRIDAGSAADMFAAADRHEFGYNA
ncbi:hypothetical protein LPB72_21170 [Hydrogenophaga crassostreae]|uniref:Uncharacterized protein n=1 Tax=Hydrogenophaga crassostreae TaxID=1763535 RepID=A0A167GIN6_9BURK|nr:hypothetical protein [Hydrogenophaga crassostreae]AOW15046.1 hypothetical protein LPB072_21785 [Hydrogenophaga crassostreae]OAD39498.1 hypothetical protein LPB72_21170 [Hydrogenophaga crassostreae]